MWSNFSRTFCYYKTVCKNIQPAMSIKYPSYNRFYFHLFNQKDCHPRQRLYILFLVTQMLSDNKTCYGDVISLKSFKFSRPH